MASMLVGMDEIAVDFAKLDTVATMSNLILQLFNTQIDLSMNKQTNYVGKNKKHWITLTGDANNRSNAKKFIVAICNPELVQSFEISAELLKKLETNEFKNHLIRTNQVFLKVVRDSSSKITLTIQGKVEDVVKVNSILEEDLAKKNSQIDNDVIVLNDSPAKSKAIPSQVYQVAIEQGFTIDEIQRAFFDFDMRQFNQDEFLEHLKQQRLNKNKKKSVKMSDCEIVEVIESKKERSVLNEYAEMFETQEFVDEEKEKMNKVKRLSKLIAAMPHEQKLNALSQVNKYNMGKKEVQVKAPQPVIILCEDEKKSTITEHGFSNFEPVGDFGENYEQLFTKNGKQKQQEKERYEKFVRNNRSKSNNPRLVSYEQQTNQQKQQLNHQNEPKLA